MTEHVEDTGNIVAGTRVQDSGSGYKAANGKIILWGTEKADMAEGTAGDDVFFSRGLGPGEYTNGPGQEDAYLKGGHDTVVLPGKREDYVAMIPGVGGYPAKPEARDYTQNDGFLYGSRIILKHDKTENSITIVGAERVVFDQGTPFANPREASQTLETRIGDGSADAVSTRVLMAQAQSGMSQDEIRTARLASTREFAQSLQAECAARGLKGLPMGRENADLVNEIEQAALEATAEKLPDIMKMTPWQPDAAPAVQPAAPTVSPAPAPGGPGGR